MFSAVTRVFYTLLLLPLLCTCVSAQSPVAFGQRFALRSDILGEDRVLNVLLPAEYEDSTANSYPVIYLLDGGTTEDFFHAAGLVRYFDDHGMMPPAILVGIANTDRKRDFTYPSRDLRDQQDFPTGGGSANFVRFLQTELTAWTDATFRTTSHRTLIGQSLGGLLATEILLKHPGYFNDYAIVSPSLWWDKEGLYRGMDSLASALEIFPDRIFVSVGEEYPVMVGGSRKLARLLNDKTDATFLPLPDEDHNTILHEALYRALDGWYDPTVPRPYHFANARNGLNLRSGPSLDSAIVGKLAYGDPLGIISAPEDKEATIGGLRGKWIYIGSDAGRGWVFDAYVSPVRVFKDGIGIQQYARKNLDLTDSLFYSMPGPDTRASYIVIRHDTKGNKFTRHQLYESFVNELRIINLTESQALVTAKNWMISKGYEPKTIAERLKLDGDGLWVISAPVPEPDGKYLSISYWPFEGELIISRQSDGPGK